MELNNKHVHKLQAFYIDEINRYDYFLNHKPLEPKYSQTVHNHSPDGFNHGYLGSGVAQLALAVCLEIMGRQDAVRVYQRFKERYLSSMPHGKLHTEIDLEFTIEDI